jgi:hypothetical protein
MNQNKNVKVAGDSRLYFYRTRTLELAVRLTGWKSRAILK